ncbi:MICAL-like protein 1 [Onychomys torridus]|uniref:MICAL-like protein 1 n=1 Tax=Onychomys torridus TaxID=38674 RepID=UPI00167FBD24|nr:MICAL-like protein 1 [Onychomys torridus]
MGPRLARATSSPLTSRDVQKRNLQPDTNPRGWEAAKQTRKKPTTTPGPLPPGSASGDPRWRKEAQAFRTNALLVRRRAPRPRPSRSRQDPARASEVRDFKAPPCSSAPRPRVPRPVPVAAPPPRGNTPEGLISGTGGWLKRALPVVPLPISLEAQALALGAAAPPGAECSSARGGARFLTSEPSRDAAARIKM